jgi:hypothetical protein
MKNIFGGVFALPAIRVQRAEARQKEKAQNTCL